MGNGPNLHPENVVMPAYFQRAKKGSLAARGMGYFKTTIPETWAAIPFLKGLILK